MEELLLRLFETAKIKVLERAALGVYLNKNYRLNSRMCGSGSCLAKCTHPVKEFRFENDPGGSLA